MFSDIERSLVLNYARNENLDLSVSKFVSDYVSSYTHDEKLESEIQSLGKFSLEELSVAFELLIPSSDRTINGTFFTPSYIVDFIIESVAPCESESIADISCGCGAFLLGILRYYKNNYNSSISSILKNNLYGADILQYNIQRAKVLICLFGLINNEVIKSEDINIICGDSLELNWQNKFDCIVGNPPYVKFQDLEDKTRANLLKNWATTSFGTFNLYFAFFEVGYNLLTDKGRLGYITPNNYFTSLAGESLRQYFHKHRCIYKIIDFSSTKVFNVQTYTAITFLNKSHNKSIAYSRIKEGISPSVFLKKPTTSSNLYENLSPKKWRLLCGNEQYNIKQIETIGDSIGNLFNICVGIATLKDDIYTFFPTHEDGHYYYFQKNDKNWKVEKELTRRTVKISDLKSQTDLAYYNRFFIFPYKNIQGKMVAIPELTMKENYPECFAYFTSVKSTLAKRGKGKQIFSPFYSYGRTQGLNRKGIKLYTPTFSKHPRFIVDFNEESLFTNGYGIFFKEDNESLFECNPLTLKCNVDVIQKILNSEVMNYYITATSVAIEGGFPCYQKNFIEKFTIPQLEVSQIEKIRSLDNETDLNKYLASLYQIKLPEPNRFS